ncbi:hypothetical protein [Microbacterium oleivorans]|uniref:Uncharacterized protein n=1 Tax=Microbacterium oleivorans TaxID=273677 RepID=A0A4R5YHL4_9MICO|nr:hypothetical protein [Microbacterium oleivorans]TDL43859.1 hypothetical protein E2R54_11760 [Microbacterium oleivorans]
MSIIGSAFADWREVREEYEEVRIAAYMRAEEATNGKLLNSRGRAAGIDPGSLFMGNDTRARAYASPELLEHWETHPRVTYADYERQWVREREAEMGLAS